MCVKRVYMLPAYRVKEASVFEIIGLDVAGPLYLKERQKVWILLITCAIYRAVHLELLTARSTDNFLLALRRFISRRGRPSKIYSDNGTNFVGFEKLLRNVDLERLKGEIAPITWKFIPPSAPWWGGFWERLVGLMKQILRKVLGRTSLSYEEMATVLCECECLLNSRPLTHVSDDANDLNPITPAMFLQENKSNDVTDLDQCSQTDGKSLNKRLAYRLRILKDLRSRFRVDYLGQLRESYRKKNNVPVPKVGDIVLVWSDNIKRLNWPMARILETYPSQDGLVRLAKIKTKSGVFIRPVQKLCPMELDSCDVIANNTPNDCVNPNPSVTDNYRKTDSVTTRAGRVVRVPQRFGQ
ncbi:uncharacterized protein [Parasteatoda tepidariorum]|uniref:uncharacterized protein n=1 Tax=Parasteatoda tepidariorum TaxID=114398 RepID=UPI0039BD31B6